MPCLSFFRGEREVIRFPLLGEMVTIGRHVSNDICLQEEAISRQHARLELRDGVYWIIDQSRNGTWSGPPGSGQRRITSKPLQDRDEVTIGSWRLLYRGEETGSERETMAMRRYLAKSFCGMIGQSLAMKQVFSLIEKVASPSSSLGNLSVLILGETGTGKELVARAIHNLSVRNRGPFVALNCGAISPQLIESELFGHEKGAFTGALVRHTGAFEQAFGGTLLLDEVGELPLELQPKLLRVLEQQTFRRVGGHTEIATDVRVIAATHRHLEERVKNGTFREDLFFRLYGVPITLTPLRERTDDIPPLVDFFLGQLSPMVTRKVSAEALEQLSVCPWRGNIRELKNTLARALLLTDRETLETDDLHLATGLAPMGLVVGMPPASSLKDRERRAILEALQISGWNKREAADALGIAKSTLFQKIRDYQIQEKRT